MLRKLKTRQGTRKRFFHERESESIHKTSNSIIRPPTSHHYSGYKNKKSHSQIRNNYMTNFNIEQKQGNQLKQLKRNDHFERLPQPFKQLMSELRIYFKNKAEDKCLEQDQLSKNLIRSILEINRQKENYLKNLKEEKQKNRILKEKIQELEKGQKLACQALKKNQKRNNRQDGNQEKYQKVLLQNIRLGQLNSLYKEKIVELEGLRQQFEVSEESKRQNNDQIDTELLRCQNRISYLEIKLQNSEKLENQLLLAKQALDNRTKELEEQTKMIEKNYQQCLQNMNQWREKAFMQKQDGQIHISRQFFLLYSIKKLRESNKNLMEKLLSLCNGDEQKIDKKDFVKSPNFDYQLDFFRSIPKIYEKGKIQRMFSMGEVTKNQLGLDMEGLAVEADFQSYKKMDTFNMSSLRIYRPSFFSFIQESVNQDIQGMRTKSNNSVSRIFIQLMRSIMNCKMNEFTFSEIEKYSRFPEFVFNWFEKFYFNTDKNAVCALQSYMKKPISQQIFYRDLMNAKLDQSWEIITFREFLLEELSLEELYFYLSCQKMLYVRAGIDEENQYLGHFSILVEYSAAKAVLDVTLNDFESWNISFLTSKLRDRLVVKKGKEYIEAGFFLRCLVQYYRIERINRYQYIIKLCSQFGTNNKVREGLKFPAFMTVISKFTELPYSNRLQLYRDCFSLTKGTITAESIFIMCSESLIFLKYLKMKSFFRLPKIAHRPTKNLSFKDPSQHMEMELTTVQTADIYLLDVIRKFYIVGNETLKTAQEMGVQEVLYQLTHMMKVLDEKNSELGSSTLKCKHFIHYFMNAITALQKISFHNFYELLQETNKRKTSNFWVEVEEAQLVKLFISQISASLESSKKLQELRIQKNNIYKFRLHHAAKTIQKQVKKKFIDPYNQIYSFLSNEHQKL